MNIQEILFPRVGRCTEEELYFRLADPAEILWVGTDNQDALRRRQYLENSRLAAYDGTEGCIRLASGGKVWFNTYFNGFSMEKWKKYTVLEGLSLTLRLSGRVKITLCAEEKIHDDIISTVLAEETVESAVPAAFTFRYPGGSGKGMYSFRAEAAGKEAVIYGGAYGTEIPEEKRRQVKIAAGICTFRREAFVERNLRILRENILENPESPMYGHLEVFVSDNGKTLDRKSLETENIHLFPNPNLGGTGGFTRDLIEMMKRRQELGLTHVLLMDDDIVIEPEALVRTWTMLSLLKDEYAGAFIGGAMLRLDKQSIQVESGAAWNGGALNSLKAGLDLRSLMSCLYNEFEEYREFNAWWYCCFPMEVVREDNLPLPIFIRGDDVEYGLRNMKQLILLNGICVWHEPFENKYSSFLEYYIVRNQLIDNAFHCPWYGAKQLKKAVWVHCRQEIMFYRYRNVDLYIRGIEDFLKGPDWLMEQDGEALHKEIMAAGYRAVELSELDMPFSYPAYEASRRLQDTVRARIKRVLTLNGLLLPATGEAIVPVADLRPVMFYRKKRIMHYDVTSKKAFLTEKSGKEAWRCIFKTIAVSRKISRKLARAQRAYREEGRKLRTLEFWNRFLGLE